MLINSNNRPIRIVGIGTMSNDLKDFLTAESDLPVEILTIEDAQSDANADQYQYLVTTIKSLPRRAAILDWLDQSNLHSPVYIHDRAYVVDPTNLGAGTIVFPMASILKCSVGRYNFISPNCHIGHCVELADRCLMLPGSIVCGSVKAAKNLMMQTGSILKDNIVISAEAVNVLPRSLISKDIDTVGTYGGAPARRISSISCLEAEYWNQ